MAHLHDIDTLDEQTKTELLLNGFHDPFRWVARADGGSVRFLSVSRGGRIEVLKYTRHKPGKNPGHSDRLGKRYRRLLVLPEGAYTWTIPASYFGSSKRKKLFKFRLVLPSGESYLSRPMATYEGENGNRVIQVVSTEERNEDQDHESSGI